MVYRFLLVKAFIQTINKHKCRVAAKVGPLCLFFFPSLIASKVRRIEHELPESLAQRFVSLFSLRSLQRFEE